MQAEAHPLVAFDMKACWQARALAAAKGQTHMVLMSVLAHTYQEALPVFLTMNDPDWFEPSLPCLCSCAKVSAAGTVVADVIDKKHNVVKDAVMYASELAMRDDFRRLADRLNLNDDDRVELFKCVQRWVVADRRLDPTFDPKDPDAKRLRLN